MTLLIVFSSAGEAAVYFTPAEVDFLFAAPFTRRELLYYKLARTFLALLVMSAFFSLTFLTSIHYWPWGYVGLLLAMAMVQLLGMVTALTGQIVAESAYTRARKSVLLAVAVVVLAGLADVTRRVEGQTPREIADPTCASRRSSACCWRRSRSSPAPCSPNDGSPISSAGARRRWRSMRPCCCSS